MAAASDKVPKKAAPSKGPHLKEDVKLFSWRDPAEVRRNDRVLAIVDAFALAQDCQQNRVAFVMVSERGKAPLPVKSLGSTRDPRQPH